MSKKRFDINDYKGNYCMHCDTEEKAKTFCEYLDSVGRVWISSIRYIKYTNWGVFEVDTCYAFNRGQHADLDYYSSLGYGVLNFDDFDWSEKDLIKDTLQKVEDERQKESHEVLQGKKTGSMVNHPDHYQGQKYEVIDIIEDFNLNFSLGSAVKYILRAGKKDDRNQDLEKAIWYLKRELKIE